MLDQPVVGIELAIAVGALGYQDIDVLDRRRIGQEVRVAAAQVAGEDKTAGPAVFAIVELDDRRAQDVSGVDVGQGHARHHFDGLVVGNALEPLDHPLDVGQIKERFGSLDVRVLEMGVAHFLALDSRTVAEHDVGDVAGRRRREDRSGITGPIRQGRRPMWSLWACETITASSARGSNGNWRLGLLGSIRSESNNPQSSKIRLESISNR